jgi:uncharacterized membrane protein YoaK (UPF0700 family)
MPASPLNWTAAQRNPQSNIRLGAALAFVAGAANAGGFLAVGQYTSHMTGIVSLMADQIVLGHLGLAAAGAAALLAFMLGAMATSLVVNWARRRGLQSRYALPVLLESALMLLFGLMGATLQAQVTLLLPATVLLLCFMMGLQNAVITKVSHAEIRTTHVTGLVTDMGIELGKLLYVNRTETQPPVRASRSRLRTQGTLLGLFFLGGVLGAWGFQRTGFLATVPLALLLALLAWRPLVHDLNMRRR